MIVEQIVDIPADRRITLEVPRTVPVGKTILTFKPATDHRSEADAIKEEEIQNAESADDDEEIDDSWFERGEPCPICAKYRDPVTGELRLKPEIIAGMQEVEDMISGKIPVKWHTSIDDLDEMLGL